MKTTPRQTQVIDDAAAGAAIYSRPFLAVYDLYVLGFSNRFIWQCPSRLILDFYNQHVSGKHLDVGVGTGYFLDKCTFPVPNPTIALVDLNENSLHVTAKRLRRYNPSIHVANVLEPFQMEPAGFGSVAINYLLHCLPGNLLRKGIVFKNLKAQLDHRGGVIFGTTILGKGVRRTFPAKVLMQAYNAKGIFANLDDHAADLEDILKANFRDYFLRVIGCVAFFAGQT
jgi:hypothetical protein